MKIFSLKSKIGLAAASPLLAGLIAFSSVISSNAHAKNDIDVAGRDASSAAVTIGSFGSGFTSGEEAEPPNLPNRNGNIFLFAFE